MGQQSSDEEELNDVPDVDQYDTEDSFIDDAELDEYFQVDKLKTKHNGYFVNKGELEQIISEPSSSVKETPKKKVRRESMKNQGDDHKSCLVVTENMGSMQIKDAFLSSPVVGRGLSSNYPQIPIPQCELFDNESKGSVIKMDTSTGILKKRSPDLSNRKHQVVTEANNEVLSLPLNHKYDDNHNAGSSASNDIFRKSKGENASFEAAFQTFHSNGYREVQSQWFMNGGHEEVRAKVRHRKRYKTGEVSGWNSFGSAYPTKAEHQLPTKLKEGSSGRPKRTTLERAIHDLERIVAEYRPPSFHVQRGDPAIQGVKMRLPEEVKPKLAKVARLSASQGKISQELTDRLMGILGHLVQRRTLKRNMKEMIELGLSAKQQNADRFQHIKREVYEMIEVRVSHLKSKVTEEQDASADYFPEVITSDERNALKGRYNMDVVLEDKICDLYDLHVEGMDEGKGPQSRKLYVELAELWPSGYMDNIGIKDAIYRSKERKRMLYGTSKQYKVQNEQRIKRKKLASSMRVDARDLHERLSLDSGVQLEMEYANQYAGDNKGRFPDDANKSLLDSKREKEKLFDSWEKHAYSMKIASQDVTEPHISLEHAFLEQPQLTLELSNVADSNQLN